MADKELERKKQQLESDLNETQIRIRRYTLDPRLRDDPNAKKDNALRDACDAAWKAWLEVWEQYNALGPAATDKELLKVEKEWRAVDHSVDLIQRELITAEDYAAGKRTVFGLTVALGLLILLYLLTHGVRSLDFSTFEPFPEWGPMKYFEVAFWSGFGVLCGLLFLATYYLTRRDFDRWYQLWYVSTALRAPFLSVILMVVVLEFVEWYGEGTWIQDYLLEEGNKFYFIVLLSFCLGLMSQETSGIIRQLAEGVVSFVRAAVGRVSSRLGSAISRADVPRR